MSKKNRRSDLPRIFDWAGNPVGGLIAIALLIVLLTWISTPSTSPFGSNSTITTQMERFADALEPVWLLMLPFAPVMMLLGYFTFDEEKRQIIRIKISQLGRRTGKKGSGFGMVARLQKGKQEDEGGEDEEV